MSLLNLLI